MIDKALEHVDVLRILSPSNQPYIWSKACHSLYVRPYLLENFFSTSLWREVLYERFEGCKFDVLVESFVLAYVGFKK